MYGGRIETEFKAADLMRQREIELTAIRNLAARAKKDGKTQNGLHTRLISHFRARQSAQIKEVRGATLLGSGR